MPHLTVYQARDPLAALVLAHGAGAGQTSAWMVKAARALSGLAPGEPSASGGGESKRGITCATFDFPYINAGRKVPDRAPVLEAHWRAVVDEARTTFAGLPLFIGGKSMGGRIASHIAAQGVDGVAGLVFFGYPLHPPASAQGLRRGKPGQPQKRRDAHLPSITLPMLFIQGALDQFGDEREMRELMGSLPTATLHVVAGGDHSFKVRGGAAALQKAFDDVMSAAARWMVEGVKSR